MVSLQYMLFKYKDINKLKIKRCTKRHLTKCSKKTPKTKNKTEVAILT